MTGILDRLKFIRQQIQEAAEKVQREPEDISIVAVTKNVHTNDIVKAVSYGLSMIGENRVQEARRKFQELKNEINEDKIKWHFIGHLQRNKVRHALEIFELIHSLDSWKLAQEIEKVADRLDITVDCLLEINVTGKSSRIGIEPKNALALAKDISLLDRIRLRGVMSIAPIVDEPGQAKPYFRMTREICETLNDAGLFAPGKVHISMGMTNDFQAAIEEGSTMVRIGAGIFGPGCRR